MSHSKVARLLYRARKCCLIGSKIVKLGGSHNNKSLIISETCEANFVRLHLSLTNPMATSILAFLSGLAEQDIRLWLEDGQLRFNAPEGAFTQDVKEAVLGQKAEIISFLASAEQYTASSITRRDITKPAALSFSQQRLWLLDQIDPGSSTYNIPAAFLLEGALDLERLKSAFAYLIDRHESLRTRFAFHDNIPTQTIEADHTQIGEWWSLQDQKDNQQSDSAFVAEQASYNFDLATGPLLRISLLKKHTDQYLLVVNMHHIVSDAQSAAIFLQELIEVYGALELGERPALSELTIQYPDFSVWQRDALSESHISDHMIFWREQLKGADSLQLPLDKARPAIFTERGAFHFFDLPQDLGLALKKIAEQNGVTLFMLCLAIYQLFLSRYSAQKDISVGTPISNRPSSDLEGIIGFFGNTLVLRNQLDYKTSFKDFLKQVEKNTLAAFSHQDLPFEMLVDDLVSERDMSSSPLFQSMFTLTLDDASAKDDRLSLGSGIKVSVLESVQKSAKYDFSLSIHSGSRNNIQYLGASIEYCADLFNSETIARMAKDFITLAESISRDIDQSLGEFNLVDHETSQAQVVTWNQSRAPFPELCLHELIDQQALQSPDACALIFEKQVLSYAQLKSQSDIYAQYFLEQGLGAGEGAALALQRSDQLVLALLGVLKCGAYYIPIDPEYPQDRIDYVLKHSAPKLVISEKALAKKVNAHTACVFIENVEEIKKGADCPQLSCEVVEQSATAYVIYTSGSTGLPKGVEISHRAFVNFIQGMKDHLELDAEHRVLALTSLSFDIAGLEIWAPLVNGATLIVASKEDANDQDRLRSLIDEQQVNLIQATPATWQMLLATDWRKNKSNKTIKALCGGEALPLALARNLLARDLSLYNMYGPTETTVWSAVKQITKHDKKIFIGKPINNTQLYILDESLKIVPLGAVGDLYIAGEGLAEGYFKQPELSVERFIDNPFCSIDKHSSARMYHTGDLARWTSSGELECLGRSDSQVKIRGFRIELGEIESVIKLDASIQDAAVVVKTIRDENHVCAYIVLKDKSQNILLETVKAALSAKLPAYMLPSHISVLDALPLTPNGKVDRKSLPEPKVERQAYVAPDNERQKSIQAIWQTHLKLEKVSIDDNFFEIGGQSLLATQINSHVRELFKTEIPLKFLFEYPTIRSFEIALGQLLGSGVAIESTSEQFTKIEAINNKPIRLPLSFSQSRLWFLDQLSPNSSAYHIPMVLRLSGAIDVDRLELAIQSVIGRHEILQTVFKAEQDIPYQLLSPQPWHLERLNAQQISDAELKHNIHQFGQKTFDLSADVLLRVALFQQGLDHEGLEQHVLAVVMHHIVSDAWSMELLIQEVLSIYQTGSEALNPLTLQYSDYSLWQNGFLQGDELAQHLGYWRERLQNVPVLQLPTDKERPLHLTNEGGSVGIRISKSLSKTLKEFNTKHGFTSFMTIMSAFQVLLSRYSGQTDFAVGTPVANREQKDIQNLIGFFVNTLAIRSSIELEQSFVNLANDVKRNLLDAYQYQSLPFERVVDALAQDGMERNLNHSPVFQAMLVLNNENFSSQQKLELSEVHVERFEIERNSAKFDLSLELNELNEVFVGELEYNTELFSKEAASAIAEHFIQILQSCLLSPKASVQDIPLLNPNEQAQQLSVFNDQPSVHYEQTLCLHQIFEKQVNQNPDAIALIHGELQLSYRDINTRSNHVARHLIAQGVKPGDVLGLCLPASVDLLVGLLGVLKAGGTYLPMDIQYPDERLAYFITDSACRMVLCHEAEAKRLPANDGCEYLCLDQHQLPSSKHSLEGYSDDNPNIVIDPSQYLYVIYTSGSTGQPNRTATTHTKESNLLHWYINFNGDQAMGAGDRLLLVSALGFDLTQKNLFAPVLSGAAIVLPEQRYYDAESIADTIADQQVTWLNCAPSMLYPLIELAPSKLQSLRYIFLGGEPIALSRVKNWYQQSQSQIVNSYGPTECTDVSHFHVLSKDHEKAAIPIGRCIPNVRHYVFDAHMQLLPIGAVGELYLSGDSLGPGYLNDLALTEQRFIEHPFLEGERVYKTGDLVRFNKKGVVEYIGRSDFQVKIRGVRIELAEIEQVLLSHEKIKAATVIVRDGLKDKQDNLKTMEQEYLAAYLVLENAEDSIAGELIFEDVLNQIKKEIVKRLPSFMMPRAWVNLNELPLSPNGKVDQNRLPVPQLDQKAFIAPSTDTEIELAKIWKEVLKVEAVGCLDNFFELGGHSLLATRVVSKVQRLLSKELPLVQFFELEDLAQHAAFLDRSNARAKMAQDDIQPLDYRQPQNLSFGQQRLWFLEKLNPGSSAYHMPAVLNLEGVLDPKRFQESIALLAKQQFLLRSKIIETDGVAKLLLCEEADSVFNYVDLSDSSESKSALTTSQFVEQTLFEPLDFNNEFLYRVKLIRQSEGEYSLVLMMHHIIADGWSMDVMMQNLFSIYFDEATSAASELSYQYVDFAAWQSTHLNSSDKAEAVDYWQKQLNDVSALDLPTDYIRPNVSKQEGGRFGFSIDRSLSNRITTWAKQHRATNFMVLMTAYQAFLSRMSGQYDFAIGTPIANREQEGLDKLIGFFVNTLALRSQVSQEITFRELLEKVKTQSVEAHAYQWLPFELLVDALDIDKSLSRTPIFQTMFVMQEQAFSGDVNVEHIGLKIKPGDITSQSHAFNNKFELMLELSETEQGFVGFFEYDKGLFTEQSIGLYTKYFIHLLEQMVEQSDAPVSTLPLEPLSKTQETIARYNDNARDYPRDLCLIDIYELSLARRRDHLAIRDEHRDLSYAQLDALANAFAFQLQGQGITAQRRVALYFDRSIDFVIAILACHKLSAVYVPINPDYPKDRRDYILNDSTASVILYQVDEKQTARNSAEQDSASFDKLNIIALDPKIEPVQESPPRLSEAANSCAAVLYTSGSTGEPKGVQLTHRGISRLVINSNYFDVNDNDCFAMVNNICFDASSYEIWGSLLNGAHMVVFSADTVLSPQLFKQANQVHRATSMLVPTGLFHNTVAENPSTFLGVKNLLIGGEAVDLELAQQVLTHSKPEHFINVYGPTENATITTTWEIGGIRKFGQKVNIGAPIANTSVYIVDHALNLLPTGVPGELLCAGDGLSLGYQNKNTPNQKNFINHPFAELELQKTPQEKNIQAYLSGDIARYLANGELEFLGRKDHQVKIRGYRVEPDELAAIINGLDQVEHATVLAVRNEQSQAQALHLIAYYVARGEFVSEKNFTGQDLRRALQDVVPTYMLPSLCVPMDEIPLTPNGKIDKRALPAPNWQDMVQQVYVAPESDLQKQMAELWANILGLERVGLKESFFDVGGNSLSATRVIAQCSEAFGQNIPLRTLFDAPVLESFCVALEGSSFSRLAKIKSADRSEPLPLSFSQKRLWFLEQFTEANAAYHVPLVLRVQGDLDLARLQRALQKLVDRHEIFRTNFVATDMDQGPRQMIHPNRDITLDSEYVRANEQEQIQSLISKPFDLANDLLLRVKVFVSLERGDKEKDSKDQTCILVMVLHHIITDAWSLELMQKELFAEYLGLSNNNLPDLHYADYAVWESSETQQTALSESLAYWKETLTDVPVLQMPFDRSRTLVESQRGSSTAFELEAETYQKIKSLCETYDVTPFMVFLATYQILLSRYSGQKDFAIGSPIANREHPQIENMLGFFVNTLAIRSDVSHASTFADLLAQVKKRTLLAYEHQQVPFENIVEHLDIDRNLNHSPVFQNMLVLNAKGFVNEDQLSGNELKLSSVSYERTFSKFDLSLELNDVGGKLSGVLEFNRDLYEEVSAQKMVAHFQGLLTALVSNPEQALSRIPLLSDIEQMQQVEDWNRDETQTFDSSACLHQRFERQVEISPELIALIHQDKQLSYEALNKRANQLAHYLIEQGVADEQVIAVCLPPGEALVVSLLAVLKAGATYLPMDVEYPDERLRYFIKDSDCTLTICQERDAQRLCPDDDSALLIIDQIDASLSKQAISNPGLDLDPNQLLYVIYTSGSTGKPNRTATTHVKEANLLQWYINIDSTKPMTSSDRVLLVSALGFDLTQKNLFAPLISGAALVLPDHAHYDVDNLSTLMFKEKITWLNCAPSLFYPLVEIAAEKLTSLRYVFLGGEPIAYQRLQKWHQQSACQLVNSYGPTECTDVSHFYVLDKGAQNQNYSSSIPIGECIANVHHYIFDENLQLLPQGSIGQLFIGGLSVGPGYLNNPELSAQRFIQNPYKSSERLYNTGDLARFTKNGLVEYIGRTDFQVKIRGVRIELAEIEQVLFDNQAIRACCVMVRNAQDDGLEGDEYLAAYVVTRGEQDFDALKEGLKSELNLRLPSFMQVKAWTSLSELPLSPNGKVDRKQLPIPSIETVKFLAPSGNTEEVLAAIWKRILQVEHLGANDNFFDLGGHSLLATRILSAIRLELKKDIKLLKLFEYPQLSSLASYLDSVPSGKGLASIPKADRNSDLLLSYGQQRIWFLEQLNPGSSFYHMPAILKLDGELDLAHFEKQIKTVIKRHESLRTVFRSEGSALEPHQVIQSLENWALDFVVLSFTEQEEREAHIKTKAAELLLIPFDLSEGPLFRVHVLQVAEDSYIVLAVMHHIISDGWSIELLLNEIMSAYLYGEAALPEITTQYADFAQWQRHSLQDVLSEQENYWCKQLKDVPVLEMPKDRTRPAIESHQGSSFSFELNKDLSQKLKYYSENQGATLFMTLMAAYQVFLSRYSGQNDFAVGTPIANRSHPELENLIGCFINTLAIRARLDHELSFDELVEQVKHDSLQAFEYQDLPFEKIVDALKLERSMSHAPIFQVMLVVNNQAVAESLAKDLDQQKMSNLQVSMVEAEHVSAKFDLNLEFSDQGDQLVGHLEYNTDLFDQDRIESMLGNFKTLLTQLVENSESDLANISLLDLDEQEKQLYAWNAQLEVPINKEQCLHTRFEQQVLTNPDATAIIYQDQRLSYQALNQSANQVARHLQHKGLVVGDLVGLCLPPTPDLLIALFGILKAGGTYLPMDVQYPEERLSYFIEDSACQFVLCYQVEAARLAKAAGKCQFLSLDQAVIDLDHYESTDLGLAVNADQYLYEIYTSGSTGQPNRTATSHWKESNLLNWYLDPLAREGNNNPVSVKSAAQSFRQPEAMKAQDRVLLVSALGFDLTQKNFFAPLVCGAAIVLPDFTHYDSENLSGLIQRHKVSWLNCAPSAFYPLAETHTDFNNLTSLRYVFLGGEAIAIPRLADWYMQSHCSLVNSYGPTECTDVSHYYLVDKENLDAALSIGRCIPNVKHYVFDEQLQLLPQGSVGELYLGGASLGPGYLNNDELSTERFIENPYIEGERLYKTGDLVRFRQNGLVDYIGRRDFQVKIRGVRIELPEIEQAILSHEQVQACSVIVRNSSDDGLDLKSADEYLAAYLVLDESIENTGSDGRAAILSRLRNEIKQTLIAQLPSFMVPRAWVCLEGLPLSANGKIDRDGLPIPVFEQQVYVAPTTDHEIVLAEIWSEILGFNDEIDENTGLTETKKISTQDNFFDLGGHSLLATRVVAKVRSEFSVEIALRLMFELQTLEEMAAVIATLQQLDQDDLGDDDDLEEIDI